MVTAQEGLLTTVNEGSYNATGGTGERILIDYKDSIIDYEMTDLPALSLFCEPMKTDTGGNIDITYSLPSMKMEQIDEGNTPTYQHTKLRSERVSVKEWGLAVGVTRRMIEDSRFNEVELALNEARKAVDRHLTKHVVKMIFGVYDATFGTGDGLGANVDEETPESGSNSITDFSTNVYGGFIASGGSVGSGRLYEYGLVDSTTTQRSHYVSGTSATTGVLSLADITQGIDLIGEMGYMADTLFISPKHYKSLLDLADFTQAISATASIYSGPHVVSETEPFRDTLGNGFVGSLYGLSVYTNPYVPTNRYGVFDLSHKPAAYVERRGLTVEEANPGFGIVGSYLSMRYGLKIIRPEIGAIFYNNNA
jgi:hypothetical protein